MSAPQRIQRKRTKGWKAPTGAVYVGRGSKWGNPWAVLDRGDTDHRWMVQNTDHWASPSECFETRQGAHAKAVSEYHRAVACQDDAHFHGVPTIAQIIAALAGRDLMCWCPLDQPCHADVLLEIANQETT